MPASLSTTAGSDRPGVDICIGTIALLPTYPPATALMFAWAAAKLAAVAIPDAFITGTAVTRGIYVIGEPSINYTSSWLSMPTL